MTERRLRFLRLASLRERQHDAAVAHLQSARHLLETTEHEALMHESSARGAVDEQHAALCAGEHVAWMLACAAQEMELLQGARHRMIAAAQRIEVDAALAAETAARLAARQTKRLLESITEQESAVAAVQEQKTLDEVSQLLKSRLTKDGVQLTSFS